MDYYDMLEVPKNASIRKIRRHYYQLAKKYHPDKNVDETHTETFKYLSEAYSTLSNPKKRYLYDIQLEFTEDTHFPDHKFSELDLDTLYEYYERFVQSTEIKFLRTLYGSLPSATKHAIHYNLRHCIQEIREAFSKDHQVNPCMDMYDIQHLRVIDITALYEVREITLKRDFREAYENSCKIILIKMRHSAFHVYVTHSDYTICCEYLKIHIVTSLPPSIHLDGCDIYVERPINLYQHFFLTNYILQLSSEYILYDRHHTTIHHKGLRNPTTHLRGTLRIHHGICLDVDHDILNTHKHLLQSIFDFDVSKSREKHMSSYKV
jgi:curved DNA-binding protein CbpA